MEAVVAGGANQDVAVRAAVQKVRAGRAVQPVPARVAVDGVVARSAAELVVAFAALDPVVVGAAPERVVARLAEHQVEAQVAGGSVVAGPAQNGVIAVPGPDRVVPVARLEDLAGGRRQLRAVDAAVEHVAVARAVDDVLAVEEPVQPARDVRDRLVGVAVLVAKSTVGIGEADVVDRVGRGVHEGAALEHQRPAVALHQVEPGLARAVVVAVPVQEVGEQRGLRADVIADPAQVVGVDAPVRIDPGRADRLVDHAVHQPGGVGAGLDLPGWKAGAQARVDQDRGGDSLQAGRVVRGGGHGAHLSLPRFTV